MEHTLVSSDPWISCIEIHRVSKGPAKISKRE